MKEKTIQIEIPFLLPDLEDECDQCLERLLDRLQVQKGILQAHLACDQEPPALCVHYQPNLITLEDVRRLAREAGARLTARYRHERISIRGLDNADEAPLIRRDLETNPGVLHAQVNYAAGLIFLAYDTEVLSREDIASILGKKDIRAVDYPEVEVEEESRKSLLPALPRWMKQRLNLILVGLAGILLLLGWIGERSSLMADPLPLLFFLFSYLAGGWDIFRRAVPELFEGQFDTDILMLAAAGGAAVLDRWAEGAFLLFLFSLGHAGEHYALDRARTAVNALGELMPQTARVRREGEIREISISELAVSDTILVRPGDRIPADGEVDRGESAVDQSPITGESLPVPKEPGKEVFAGTVNLEGELEITVSRRSEDNTLSRVMQLVAEAQAQQSPTQRFSERFSAVFVPAVLGLVLAVIALPPLLGWMVLEDSFYRGMLLLVAASPCALALGAPAAVLTGIAQAARSGVLIKGGAHLENLGTLQGMAFDKTGTLTAGNFQLTDLIPAGDISADQLLRLAAAVEQRANHPLAAAVVRAAEERGLELPESAGLENLSGRGVRSEVEGERVLIGSPRLFRENSPAELAPTIEETVDRLESQGKSIMLVQQGEILLGILALADRPRSGVKETLHALQDLGIRKLVMLTGDNSRAASSTAEALGMTDFRSNLLPEEKLSAVRDLQEKVGKLAMVGDGVNDAPALAAAAVGIAMGGAGTAAALETADVALMADDLGKLPFAIGLSRASRRVMIQNLVIALGVIGVLIVSSVLGWLQLGWAVALHEGSSLAVVLNALRLLRYREE